VDRYGNHRGLTRNEGHGGLAYLIGTLINLVITIYLDDSAFNRRDCGRELARILQVVTDRVDLESKSDLIRGYLDDPKSLLDINGNTVGSMEIADEN
jgi:hypothetical protein